MNEPPEQFGPPEERGSRVRETAPSKYKRAQQFDLKGARATAHGLHWSSTDSAKPSSRLARGMDGLRIIVPVESGVRPRAMLPDPVECCTIVGTRRCNTVQVSVWMPPGKLQVGRETFGAGYEAHVLRAQSDMVGTCAGDLPA